MGPIFLKINFLLLGTSGFVLGKGKKKGMSVRPFVRLFVRPFVRPSTITGDNIGGLFFILFHFFLK